MSYYSRNYFIKDNNIISNSEINFGGEQSAIIDSKSYYIFTPDLNPLFDSYDNCALGNLSCVKHILKLKSNIDLKKCNTENNLYNIIPIYEDYDEGCGITNYKNCSVLPINTSETYAPSNFFFRNNNYDGWNDGGGFNSLLSGQTIAYSSFIEECGELSFDITDHINNVLSGLTVQPSGYIFTNSGITSEMYTRLTATFFKPFIESFSTCNINDDYYILGESGDTRFFLDLKNNQSVNSQPIAILFDCDENLLGTYSGECIGRNIFYVDINLPFSANTYMINWTNIKFNEKSFNDIQEFYEIKENNLTPEDYISNIKISGINQDERFTCNQTRYVKIKSYNQKSEKTCGINAIEYRIYVKQGQSQLEITPWLKTNKTKCENWFRLDTSWMLKQEYHLEFRQNTGSEIIPITKDIRFYII